MSDPQVYQPTDQFRDELESAIRRRYRVNARKQSRRATRSMSRLARIAAVILASSAVGASAGFASAQIAQKSVRDSLLAAAQADATLAKTRFDVAQAELKRASDRVKLGAADEQELFAATAEFRDMESRLTATSLNIEEIGKSGRAPRDDLGAPLVSGKDYVKLRLQLEATTIQARLNLAEAALANAERRVRIGAADETVAQEARAKMLHEQGYLAVVAERLNARDEFIAKGTDPVVLLQRVELAQLKSDAAYTQAELDNAKARLAVMEKRRQIGAASEVDLLRAQLAAKELTVELQRLATRLRAVK